MTTLNEFLTAFFPDEHECVRFRLFKAKDEPACLENSPLTPKQMPELATTRATLVRDMALQRKLRNLNKRRGIYFVVNSGGDNDESIARCNAFFVECDDLSIADQHAALNDCEAQPSIRVETRKSVHAYWLIDGACSVAEWRDIQARLIAYFNGDAMNKNPSRVMRLPFFDHLQFIPESGEMEAKPVEVVAFDSERRYTLAEMRAAFPEPSTKPPPNSSQNSEASGESSPPKDKSFATWEDLNAELKRRIMPHAKMNGRGIYEMRGICHNGQGETALMFNPKTGAIKCNKGCTHAVVLRAFGMPEKPTRTQPNGANGEASDCKPSQASRLVALASSVDFFHTPEGKTFARVRVGEHIETVSVKSGAFRDWLVRAYRQAENATPRAQAMQDALTDLQGTARFDSPERECHVRIAEADGAIYVDLCNDAWQAVRVTKDGWSIIESKDLPVMFRRTPGMLALPLPEMGGRLSDLQRFINVRAEDWTLFAAWLVAAFRPNRPFPVLTLNGEQGSAKSTTARILRALIDPNKAPLRSVQRDERDLMIAATNSWVVALDNLSNIRQWLSDSLCRLSTGGGFAVRANYSDDDEVLFDAMRPILLNGIEELATRSDLLDRAIIVTLPTISEENRREQDEVWREFEAARPQLFGACLTAVVTALRDFPATQLERKPRMADFARWSVAAETTFDCAPGTFLAAYMSNRTAANELALEASPVAALVLSFMEDLEEWVGTATELLKELTTRNGDAATLDGWAKSPRALSGALKRLAPNLRASGIEVTTGTHTSGGKKRLVRLEKTRINASQPSQASQSADTQDDECDDDRDCCDETVVANETSSHAEAVDDGVCDACDGCDDETHSFSSDDITEEEEFAARLEYQEH